ncbi:MAG: PD40 domain-containing protein [Anaerolineae bacterium]|nr:PD40 domain-containing protein [Anaerolineae bacterium]
MKRVKSIFGFVGQMVLLVALALVVILVILRLQPPQPLDGQPAASPVDSPTLESGYPPPEDRPVEPTQAPSETPAAADIFPTITGAPITPFPTLTLEPGPSPTPIPILEPAQDAAGTIFFIAGEGKEASPAFHALTMDATGKALGQNAKLSEDTVLKDGFVFPSPNGNRLANAAPWGVLDIFDLNENKLVYSGSIGSGGYLLNWFPDNRRILFQDDYGPLVLLDPFTKAYTLLAVPGYGHVTAAAASPDGRHVVYAYSTDIVYPRGLWIVNTNGQDAHLLVKDTEPNNIAWSPDGKRIALYNGGALSIVEADGSNLRQIEPVLILPQCYFLPPVWSPDSRTVAVVAATTTSPFCPGWTDSVFDGTHIFVVDAESGKAQPLLPDGSMGSIDPTWSPDGSQLAFVSNRSGAPAIWAVNADGSGLRQITSDSAMLRFPVWTRSSK